MGFPASVSARWREAERMDGSSGQAHERDPVHHFRIRSACREVHGFRPGPASALSGTRGAGMTRVVRAICAADTLDGPLPSAPRARRAGACGCALAKRSSARQRSTMRLTVGWLSIVPLNTRVPAAWLTRHRSAIVTVSPWQ